MNLDNHFMKFLTEAASTVILKVTCKSKFENLYKQRYDCAF